MMIGPSRTSRYPIDSLSTRIISAIIDSDSDLLILIVILRVTIDFAGGSLDGLRLVARIAAGFHSSTSRATVSPACGINATSYYKASGGLS